MIGWLILIVYVVGLFLTWVISLGMFRRSDYWDEQEPMTSIIMLGFMSMFIGVFWPLVVLIFGVYRLATKRIGKEDQ